MHTTTKFQLYSTGQLDSTHARKLKRITVHMHVLATRANVSTPPTGVRATAASARTGIKAIRTSTVDVQVPNSAL